MSSSRQRKTAATKPVKELWKPNPRQEVLLAASQKEVLYGGAAGAGKALALDTPIPTPSGWITMADIVVGDTVFGADGAPSRVVAVYDSPSAPSYRLTFDDGSTIDACQDHRWLTFDAAEMAALTRRDPEWRAARRARRTSRAGGRKSSVFTAAISARNAANPPPTQSAPCGTVRTTAEISAALLTPGGRTNHAIPIAGALRLWAADLPVDPYCLGAWLGDGDSRRGYLTTADPEILAEFAARGYGAERQKAPLHYRIPGLTSALRALGVIRDKHVPTIYLRASTEQRTALLQGLMDTDGCVTHSGVEFTSTNRRLADAVYELIVSLGWKARVAEGRATLYGKDCGPKYRINWTPDRAVFRLPRKRDAQRLATRRTTRFRYIVACESIAPAPMRCIKVDRYDGLFLAGRQMVPTHNSDALLIDALGLEQNAIGFSDYQALLVRRTYPDLRDLIERSHALYPAFGAKYDKTEHSWRFPIGARVEFGHIQHPQDRFKYRGRAFAYIGWDELTLFPTDVAYVYLLSRLRSVNPAIRCYVRATTNPDGPGYKWVKTRWQIPVAGTETNQTIEVKDPETGKVSTYRRRFIPGRLSDNPYLNDSGYRETLLMLPPDERDALLLGRWDHISIRGAYYGAAIEKARADGRIGKVPYVPGIPVNTFWDIGLDATSIWWHQRVAMQDRFIRCYENSNEQIDYYINVLRKVQADHNYVYGTHYLPHDAKHKSMTSASFEAMFRQAGIQNLEIVPVSLDREADIAAAVRAFATCCFDETECADGISALENYSQEWDEKMQTYRGKPKHNWASHYADSFRQFAQGFRGNVAPRAVAPVRPSPSARGWGA